MSHPKLKGQRLGQVVYNAIHEAIAKQFIPRGQVTISDDAIFDKLYYISDEDLVKLINDYLKER